MAGKSQVTEAIEKLSRQPAPVKVGVFLGLALVLGVGYWFAFYSDMSQHQTELVAQRKRLADEEKSLQQRKKEYLELIKKKAQLEAELGKNAVRLPSSSELPAFFIHLQTQASAANVRVLKWNRVNEAAVENFVKVPVSMQVRGDFFQLLQYFELLGQTQRIISVENLSLGNASSEGDVLMLTAEFTASTFRQADQPPATVAPKKPGKAAAKPPAGRAAGARADGAASLAGAGSDSVTPASAAGAGAKPPAGN